MMRSLFYATISLCLVFAFFVMGQEVTIVGSSTLQPVIKAAATAIKDKDLKITVKGGGSDLGVKSVADGSADIGMASRDLKKNEPKNLRVHCIGRDGIAIIANKANSVTEIGSAQVTGIYTGKITNWKEIGGPNQAIVVGCIGEEHGTRELFDKYFGIQGLLSPNAHVTHTISEALSYVSGNESAIMYASVGRVENAVKKGTGIKALKLDGHDATTANVAGGSYPLARNLNLITKDEPSGGIKTVIDFIYGDEGRRILEANDFIPKLK